MTGQRETTRYATPSLRRYGEGWTVSAHPWDEYVGFVKEFPSGWFALTSTSDRAHGAGLWPTKQAAAEVLVKQAGYELELT